MEEMAHAASLMAVPNVQEMVRKDPLEVPENYIRSQEEIEKANFMPQLSSEIPVIDLSLLSCKNNEELLKLDTACKDWGFFYLLNHGIQKEVLQTMKDAVAEFFNLPIEEKNKYAMLPGEIQGYGRPHGASQEKALYWGDAFILVVFPTSQRKIQFWPRTPEGFKEIIEAYSSQVQRVGTEILGSLSVIMGMQEHDLLGLHQELLQFLRVNYYPPCSLPDQVLGMRSHSDTSSITLITQDDDVCGYQIRHKGAWVPVTPISEALVVNVGDALKIWSNGRYMSVEHRAVTNKNKRRFSIGSFLTPHNDAEVEPLDQMGDAGMPKIYSKIRYGDHLKQAFKKKVET